MSELNLLLFGCVVTFVAAEGVYVYIRESFLAGARQASESEASSAESDAVDQKLTRIA